MDKPIDIILEMDDINKKKKESLGTFLSESKTRLVRGRRRYKIKNKYANSCENPESEAFAQQHWPEEFSDLETMYAEFCKKAHNYIFSHRDNNGANMIHRIIFPDFHYDIIPDRFIVE